jgi:hypothetical protein
LVLLLLPCFGPFFAIVSVTCLYVLLFLFLFFYFPYLLLGAGAATAVLAATVPPVPTAATVAVGDEAVTATCAADVACT